MNPETNHPATQKLARVYGKRAVWFVTLWCVGLSAALVLAFFCRILVHAVGN